MGRNEYVGTAYAGRTAIFSVFLGERLTPDTGLYSSGHSALAWSSSPVLSLAGFVAGFYGVLVVGILASYWLGWLVASHSGSVSSSAILAISPPGWYTIQPSADSAGAAASIVAWNHPRNRWLLVMVGFFHIEASLVVLGSRIVGRYVPVRGDVLAIAMGVVACISHLHIQVRYLLPGAAILASGLGRRTFCGTWSLPFTRRSITSSSLSDSTFRNS